MPDAETGRVRGFAFASLLTSAVATLFWACLQPPLSLLSGRQDGGSDASPQTADGAATAILGTFTISGCAALTFPDGEPLCVGIAPLRVRLILVAVGATTHRFQVTRATQSRDGGVQPSDGGSLPDGGNDSLLDEASSRATAPEIELTTPGTYLVSLGVGGPGGTAAAAGLIVVRPAGLGDACDRDAQCASGLRCLCSEGSSGTCPAGLRAGLCSRGCDGTACPAGSVCVDLSRSAVQAVADGGAASDSWRRPLCVPSCGNDMGCRGDLVCRELPLLYNGASAGGAYSWGRACYIGVPGGVGASCISGDEKPDPSACALGLCEGLGLRDLCTAPCDVPCPGSAACAAWNSTTPPAPAAPRCLARCDATHPCGDPLLDCLPAGASGGLGFQLPGEPPSTTVCAPRRCTTLADCPGGRCVALGAASFCLR